MVRAAVSFWLKAQKRRLYFERGGKCELCHERVPFVAIQKHHVRPRSEMGGDMDTNLMLLCEDCHRSKHQRGRS